MRKRLTHPPNCKCPFRELRYLRKNNSFCEFANIYQILDRLGLSLHLLLAPWMPCRSILRLPNYCCFVGPHRLIVDGITWIVMSVKASAGESSDLRES